MTKNYITRFAPSPTGLMHIGHGFSALLAFEAAQKNNGKLLLRIEDIDQTRCRPEFVEAIYTDLSWLGISWAEPVRVQSEHFDDYENALKTLGDMGLLYPCFCTRAEIKKELENAPSAPHGFDGVVYPETCKHMGASDQQHKKESGTPYALRLDMAKALAMLKARLNWPLFWQDEVKGNVEATPQDMGDIILARKETPTSYHLAVSIDDHLSGITHIIRGNDLFAATHIHCLLQALLGFKTPLYTHHKLLNDEDGNRLAKRTDAPSLKSLRENGVDGLELAKKLTARA